MGSECLSQSWADGEFANRQGGTPGDGGKHHQRVKVKSYPKSPREEQSLHS